MSHRWKRLRRATVTNPGEKYQEKPAITVSEPAAPKEPAAVTPVMDGDGIASIAVDSGGNFYNTPPTVTISPPDQLSGTQATAAAVLQNFEVSSINVTDSGSGYTSPPTVTVAKSTDPKSDFTAKLSVDFDSSTGTVTKINVVDSGNFYDENNPPTITIEKPFPNQEFEVGEDVNISGIGADSTAATMTGEVAEFIEETGKLVIIHVANDTGDFVEPGPNSVVTAPASGASSIITKSENPEIPGDASDEFDDEASDFLDFSESNPFGEPEAATVAQEAAAIATQTSTPTEAVIQGTKSDPSFDYPLEYKVVANGVSYQYNASGEDERNYFEGIRDLNIPGLTIGSYNATGIINGIEVKYTPQVDGDTVKFAGSGWIHLGILEGEYGVSGDRQDLSAGDSADPQPDIEVFGAKNDPSFASGKTYTLTANGILYGYGPTGTPGDPYNGSFYAGLRALDIPGFTITVHSENGYLNAVKLEYIKQTPTDTLILDPNANGWEHLEIIPGTYDGVTTPSQGQGQGQGQGAGQGQQGGGQTADPGFMSDSDYSTRVAQSSTSSVFDSAAVNLGLEKIRFESKYHWTTSDVTGSLYMPRGVTFGDNGRKLFYVSGGAYQNTQYVYGMKMSTPYDVSSINHAESAASLNLSTHFSDIFQGGYSGQYSEHNMLDVWFNPQGTKMWVSGNTYSVVAQFALDSAWNLNGTITPEHKIGTGSLNMWSNGSVRLNNWTYDSNLQVINNYSNEWIDSGRTLISTGLSSRGDTIKQTFSTPYDISTCTSPGYNPSTIYRHTPYSDSDSDGAEYASDALRLAFNAGSVFNHDGSEMYFIHQQFDSANFNESGGSGLGGWRVNLVKATLDTPYDITTMAFDRQAEITNLAESAGGPTHVKPSGKMAIHPSGNRFYMMTYASEIAGTPNYSDFNLWEFSTQPDSAGSPAITTPDITVKPMVQGTYTPNFPPPPTLDGSGNFDASDSHTINYSLSNMIIQNDSAKAFEFNNPPSNEWWGNDTYSLTPDRFIWGDYGRKMITMGYDYLRPINYYDLSTPYDASTAILDSSKSWSTDERDSAFAKLGITTTGAHGLWDNNSTILFNADGSNFTTIGYSSTLPGKRFTTIELSNNYDISSVESYTQTDLSNSTINSQFSGYFPSGANQIKWIDSGNKLVWQGGYERSQAGSRSDFLFVHVPTPYDISSITWTDSSVWYKYVNSDWINDPIHDTLSPLEPAKSATAGRVAPYDFCFTNDGMKMYATDRFDEEIDRTVLYEINLTQPYDLRTQDSSTEVVTWPNNYGPKSIHGVSVTPTGKLILGHGSWHDSVTRSTDNTKGRWSQWDITTPAGDPTTFSYTPKSYVASVPPDGTSSIRPVENIRFKPDGTLLYALDLRSAIAYNLSTSWDLSTATIDSSRSYSNAAGATYDEPFYTKAEGKTLDFNNDGTQVVMTFNDGDPQIKAWDLDSAYNLNSVPNAGTSNAAADITRTFSGGQNTGNGYGLNDIWDDTKEEYSWSSTFTSSGYDFRSRWIDKGSKFVWYQVHQGGVGGRMMIFNVTTAYDVNSIDISQSGALSCYDFGYEIKYNIDPTRYGSGSPTWSDFWFSDDGTKIWVGTRIPYSDGYNTITADDIFMFETSVAWDISKSNMTHVKTRRFGEDASSPEWKLTERVRSFFVKESEQKLWIGLQELYPSATDSDVLAGSHGIAEFSYRDSTSTSDSSAPPAYPQQRIQNLVYDSTQELSWSTVSNEYGLEVSPDGSTIVMKDLGQNDWRVFTMSTPYDLSTAVRDTTKEPTFGMSDSAHKFKSHGMTFTSDWSKLATTRIGTPLDIYKNEISMYDITGGNSTYSLDRIDNESDGDRTSFWGTLAFEAQITDQDGTNHNQRPDNIQFGDNGQRLYWTNLNGTTNLMSQWNLSSPNTIDLDMVDSGGLYIPSITGDSDTLSAAINHDGKRVYVLTNTGYQSRGIGIYQLDLDSAWNVKTAAWNSDNFLKLSNNSNHGNVTAALGDIAVCEDYLFVSLTSDGSTVIRRYKIEDSTPPPPPPPTSNSDSDGLGYATAANWTITVDQGPLYEDSATQGNVFYGEAVASASDLTFGLQSSTANQTWSSGKIRSVTQNVSNATTSAQTTQPVDVAAGDQGNIYILDNYRTIEQYVTGDSADLSNLTHIRSFTLNDTDNQSLQFKRDGRQFYTVGSSTKEIKTYDLSTPWDISTAVENTSKTFTVSDDTSPVGLVMSPYGNSMIVLGDTNNTIYQYALDSDSYDPSTAGSNFATLDISAVTNVNGQTSLTQDAKRIRTSYNRGWNVYIMGMEGSNNMIHQGSITGGTGGSKLWRSYDAANWGGNISTFNYGTLPENEEIFSGAKGFDFSYSGRTIYYIHDGNFNYLYAGTMDIPNMSFGTI